MVAESELTTSMIEITGHSLGAQSAGMTGRYVTAGKIKRITGEELLQRFEFPMVFILQVTNVGQM